MEKISNARPPISGIENRIYLIRGRRVMLDSHLAQLYGVKPIRLRQQISIMRAFVRLRQIAAVHKELGEKVAELERLVKGHSLQIDDIIEAIRAMAEPPGKATRRIGFIP